MSNIFRKYSLWYFNKYIFQWLKWFKKPFKRLSFYLSDRVQTDDLLLDSFVHSCNRWCQNISLSMQEYTSRTIKNLSFHPTKVPENRNADIFSKRLRAADYLCIWRIILLRKAKIEKTFIQFCTDLWDDVWLFLKSVRRRYIVLLITRICRNHKSRSVSHHFLRLLHTTFFQSLKKRIHFCLHFNLQWKELRLRASSVVGFRLRCRLFPK